MHQQCSLDTFAILYNFEIVDIVGIVDNVENFDIVDNVDNFDIVDIVYSIFI